MKKEEGTKKGKLARFEKYSIYGLLLGVSIFSGAIGLSILNPKGISAILGMVGALVAFISTVGLITTWLIEEWKGE
ncbi:MAG: hypothetical protein J7K98_02340 [Candidatus Aenigmarchaeota archaeon]|nr:hypothetical protein [Candidatus Aenigmarchaeota archaeon]